MKEMKKSRLFRFIILLTFVFIPFVSSISSDMKETYAPKETIITEISGNILSSIIPEQVEFKRGYVGIPLEYDIKKIGDKYYLWAIAPENQNNYTLIIRNISTTVSGNVKQIDYMKNFSIAGTLASYTIKPGFIITKQNFNVEVTLNEDNSKSIDIDFPVKGTIVLNPGENKISFLIKNYYGLSFTKIKIGSYYLPAYIVSNQSNSNGYSNEYIKFIPRRIDNTILINDKDAKIPFSILNTGNEEIRDLYIDYDQNIFLISPRDKGLILKPQEVANLNLSLRKTNNSYISTVFYAKYGNNSIDFPVDINLTSNLTTISPNKTGIQNKSSLYPCSELGGRICSADLSCSGATLNSVDGSCCIGECKIERKGNKAWLGFLIAGIVILGFLILFTKYKKTKVGDILQKRIKQVEKEKT